MHEMSIGGMYSTFHKHGFHNGSFSTNLSVRDATRQNIILLCRQDYMNGIIAHFTVIDLQLKIFIVEKIIQIIGMYIVNKV